MSNIVKWALLAAGVIALIALIAALPVGDLSLIGNVGTYLTQLVNVCADGLSSARGLINFFLFPPVRTFLSGILIWIFFKWALMIAINFVAWVYHFVFRG